MFFRNGTRNFSEWTRIPDLGDILITSHHVRGLTRGVSYEFRVRACNNGGWGADSEPSDSVCPGSAPILIVTAARRQRLAMGGPLAILDHLALHPIHCGDQSWGLGKLNSMAQISGGYNTGALQKRSALAAMHGLQTFPNDPDMARAAFSLIGWTLVGPASEVVLNILLQNNVADLAEKWMAEYRTNSDVIGAMAWLRFNMPAGSIPQPKVVLGSSLTIITDGTAYSKI